MRNVYIKFKFPVLLLALFLTSCGDFSGPSVETPPSEVKEQFDLPAGKKNVMTVTNMSSLNANLSFAYSSRAVAAQSAPLRFNAQRKSDVPLMDLEAASRFNANPPRAVEPPSRSVKSPSFAVASPVEGAKKDFWVQDINNRFYQIPAVLQKQGANCNIWVDNNWFGTGSGKITAEKAKALADKFDEIYPLETKLLGYEYGGGPGGNGGIDGDPRIQILVYDIGQDAPQDPKYLSGVVGYFWGKDEYTQAQLNAGGQGSLKSNVAEIFYIDAEFVLNYPKLVYSTLVHEFQHMINFNRKALTLHIASETWYDEMLAMLAEDVISPLIGVGPDSYHPIQMRIPDFLGAYPLCGVDQWLEGDDVIMSYSTAYAFGAYLIRNYGGPKLIKAMLDNNAVNYTSVTNALRSVNGNSSLSFDTVLKRYAEAFLYSTTNTGTVPGNKMSFDRPQTDNINGNFYTAAAFDIWKMQMSTDLLKQYVDEKYLPDMKYKGPVIFPRPASYQIPGHSVWLHRIEDSLTGTLAVTVTVKPGNAVINLGMESY